MDLRRPVFPVACDHRTTRCSECAQGVPVKDYHSKLLSDPNDLMQIAITGVSGKFTSTAGCIVDDCGRTTPSSSVIMSVSCKDADDPRDLKAGDCDTFLLWITLSGWTYSDDVNPQGVCPHHSREFHPWLQELLQKLDKRTKSEMLDLARLTLNDLLEQLLDMELNHDMPMQAACLLIELIDMDLERVNE